jgi:hypothetical protein
MKSILWQETRRPSGAHPDPAVHQRSTATTPVAPALNTILAVREHAPAEIDELETEIQALHHRLGAAYARKRLLEQLLAVIKQADAERPGAQSGMAVVR